MGALVADVVMIGTTIGAFVAMMGGMIVELFVFAVGPLS